MTRLLAILAALFLVACSAGDDSSMFQVDPNGSGPLTLAELQIKLPDTVALLLSEEDLACFHDAVERRALDVGDPAKLDPMTQPYWNGEVTAEDWAKQSNKMQRVLVAQAVVSFAMVDCTTSG